MHGYDALSSATTDQSYSSEENMDETVLYCVPVPPSVGSAELSQLFAQVYVRLAGCGL